MSVIVIEELTRRYGKRIGIEQLNLRVPEGQLFGFLGPNGSGKTTTIRVLLGFLRPTEGSATILGHDCWRQSQLIKEDVGYLPGDLRLYPSMTGEDHLKVFSGIRRRDMLTPGRELGERFVLDLNVSVRKMSRGMRQKLGLILALAHRPRVLILDEPTASLDPLMQQELFRHLESLAKANHTIFFSSHTLSEVDRLCDHVAIVREGRLVADEPLERLRAKAKRQVTVRWTADCNLADLRVPEFLDIVDRQDRTWQANLTGEVPDLIRWASTQQIADLAIGHPDLDSLFRRYYEHGAGES